MGVCVTPLKTLRHDLTAHLANGLGAAATKLGAQVNPPTVIVQPGPEYVTPAPGYCVDGIRFQAVLIPKPGDLAAETDAMDDMVDQVRTTLRSASPGGHTFRFESVSGRVSFTAGEKDFPAVVVGVFYERDN